MNKIEIKVPWGIKYDYNDFSIGIEYLKAETMLSVHYHKEDSYYLAISPATVFIDGKIIQLQKTDGLLIPAYKEHSLLLGEVYELWKKHSKCLSCSPCKNCRTFRVSDSYGRLIGEHIREWEIKNEYTGHGSN